LIGFGFEKGHIKIGMYKAMGKEYFEPVVATTVDTIIDDYLGGVAPLILSIDTEVKTECDFPFLPSSNLTHIKKKSGIRRLGIERRSKGIDFRPHTIY
jgi:hypothetical protein